MSVTDESNSGSVFGPYRVFERIGVGGMATVHRAKELGIEGFERWVALKRLLPHLAEDESFVRSFVREAKLASLLAHPNIVQIYELGRVGSVYFISMELIEGYDVRQILRQSRKITGPPPIAVTVNILCQLCEALEYAHSRVDDNGDPLGLVHRDVSPSNVIVGQSGHIKIIDFGIAKAQGDQMRTKTGRVKGKMAYMAPEAIRGMRLDGRSDLFAVGVLAHELLTARPLFATKNDYKTLQRVQSGAIAPPSTYNRDCPPELDAIVLRALERDRDERWQTAGAIRDELYRLRRQYSLSPQPNDVSGWLDWAFALESPVTGLPIAVRSSSSRPIRVDTAQPIGTKPSVVFESSAGLSLHTPSHTPSNTPATGPMSIPVGNVALPSAEEDDEIMEIAWGGRSRNEAVILDDVPDVSARGSGHHLTVSPQLSQHHLDSAGATEAPRSPGATLIAQAPPPPNASRKSSPRSWASGTRPPRPDMIVTDDTCELDLDDQLSELSFSLPPSSPPMSDDHEVPDSNPSGIPQDVRAATSTGGNALSIPLPAAREITPTHIGTPVDVVFRDTGNVAPARAITANHARRGDAVPRSLKSSTSTASFGTHIVERERSALGRFLLGAAFVAVLGGAGFLLLRSGNQGTAAGAQAAAELASIKLVMEPANAKAEIVGAATFTSSPAKTKLAAGSYKIIVSCQGYKTWETMVDVAARENQTLHIVLASAASEAKSELVQSSTTTSDEMSDGKTEKQANSSSSSHRHRRSVAPVLTTPEEQMQGDSKSEASGTRRAPGGSSTPTLGQLQLGINEPPKAPARKRPIGPVLVPPRAVTKISGTLPTLRVPNGKLPTVVSAQLCIDEGGAVTRVKILSRLPDDASATLKSALGRWKYAPYRKDTVAIAACFAVNLRTR